MAYLTLNTQSLRHNYHYLDQLFRKKKITWAVVSKLLCGDDTFLEELLRLGPSHICDARIGNLRTIKRLCPEVQTIYIRPVPPRTVAAIIRYADISFNTQYRTLKLLSDEAVRQNKTHRVIIMVELGERREGVLSTQLATLYEKVRLLPRIKVVGLGTNFACLSGVLPDQDKLRQLVCCRKMISERFGERLKWVSGGASVAIRLLLDNAIPAGINHLRIGETLFFGVDAYHHTPLPELRQDVFTLYAQIIELIHKPQQPDGEVGQNLEGHIPELRDDRQAVAWRAIVDVGLLDVESSHLTPVDSSLQCIGASSDMLVIDLGSNPDNYKTGDYIEFRMDYMGVLRLMSSSYITKRVITEAPEQEVSE